MLGVFASGMMSSLLVVFADMLREVHCPLLHLGFSCSFEILQMVLFCVLCELFIFIIIIVHVLIKC